MLNKEICLMCAMKWLREKFGAAYADSALPHIQKYYKKKDSTCYHTYGEEPPASCPYYLEQMVSHVE